MSLSPFGISSYDAEAQFCVARAVGQWIEPNESAGATGPYTGAN